MWTIVRFVLDRGEGGYPGAFELLARAGFERCAAPCPGGEGEAPVLPAAVAADVLRDPAAVSRAVFDVLGAAGLRPVAVTAAGPCVTPPRSLAPGGPGRENGAGGSHDPREPR